MSGPSLTLEEAVPLGTVYLQQVLDAAGVRSLVIKGPAFVELGVRRARRSQDIDLIVAPDDRAMATESLAAAGWSIISHWFPPALDDVIYSTTFSHPLFPVTLDLHHHFSGLLSSTAFEALWASRTTVSLAHCPVAAPGVEHALIIETLNATKKLPLEARPAASRRVLTWVDPPDVGALVSAAEGVGARHTVAPLLEILGGSAPEGPPPPGFHRWVRRGARTGGHELLVDIAMRAPLQLPRVVWQQLTLDPAVARFWANAHGVAYRSPSQVLWVRMRRMFGWRAASSTGRRSRRASRRGNTRP